MGLSIRELKAHLSAHGVDFSTCREKTELEELWSNVQSARQAAEGTEDATKETSASADGGYSFCKQADEGTGDAAKQTSVWADGGFAMRKVDGCRCWVEFVDGDDALCHWADGSDAMLNVQDLEPSDIGSFGPPAFKGSFEEARAEAFRLGCLLVTSVGSGNESKKDRLQVLALAAEEAAVLIQENAIFWQGHIKSLRIPHQQQLAPQGVAPVISMVLPLATDAMRVLSTSEEISVESLVQDFLAALDKLEEHRQAATTRLLSSEAFLRQEQDEEYAAALAADCAKEEADAATPFESAAAQPEVQELANSACIQAAQDRDAISETLAAEQESLEAEQQLAKRRRLLAEEFHLEPDAEQPACGRVRLMLRLPKGERVERGFTAEDTLSKVQRWAECCALLPEAKGQDLVIPARFELYTAFPKRKLGGDEDALKSLKELGLAPSAALLLISSDA